MKPAVQDIIAAAQKVLREKVESWHGLCQAVNLILEKSDGKA